MTRLAVAGLGGGAAFVVALAVAGFLFFGSAKGGDSLPRPPSPPYEAPFFTPSVAPEAKAVPLPLPLALAVPDDPPDDASLMDRLRSVQESDPAVALELARDGNRRFPESPNAAERAAIIVKSLARQGRLSEARGEAEMMVNQYPDTPWAREVELHTGAHPHRRP